MSFTRYPADASRDFSAFQLDGPGRPGSITASPRSSIRPYMFTWPRPGIQIGSCMRSTPGATSVISSEACSCSCLGGLDARGSPGRLDTSVTAGAYRSPGPVDPGGGGGTAQAPGANFGQGRTASRTAPAARQR